MKGHVKYSHVLLAIKYAGSVHSEMRQKEQKSIRNDLKKRQWTCSLSGLEGNKAEWGGCLLIGFP